MSHTVVEYPRMFPTSIKKRKESKKHTTSFKSSSATPLTVPSTHFQVTTCNAAAGRLSIRALASSIAVKRCVTFFAPRDRARLRVTTHDTKSMVLARRRRTDVSCISVYSTHLCHLTVAWKRRRLTCLSSETSLSFRVGVVTSILWSRS